MSLASRVAAPLRGFLCVAMLATPWWHRDHDVLRYLLSALVLLGAALWIVARPAVAPRVGLPAAALAAWAFVQAAAVSPSWPSTVESGLVLVAHLAVLVFCMEQAREEAAARQLVFAVLLACGLQGVFGAVQATLPRGRIYGTEVALGTSHFGSYANHNHFAGLMEMGVLLALGLAIGRVKRSGAVDPAAAALIGLSLALSGAHLASRSRGGLLALLAGLGVFVPIALLFQRHRSRASIVGATTIVAVALVAFGWIAVPTSARQHLATLFQGPSDASGQYRIAIGRATLSLWGSHFVAGAGLGTFEDAVTPFKRSAGSVRSSHAESDVLEFAAEGGAVGVLLLGWLAVAVIRGFLDRMRHGHDPWRKGVAVGALTAAAGLAAHSLVDFNLRIPSNALVFCVLAGVAAAARTETPVALSRHVAAVAGVILTVLGLASAWRAAGAIQSLGTRDVELVSERLASLSRLVEAHPYLATAYRDRAHARWSMSRGSAGIVSFRLQGARDDLERSLRLRPRWSYAWADVGWVQFLRGDVADAGARFDRAVALDPASLPIGLARAEFYFRTDRPAEGRKELRRIRLYNTDWPAEAADAAERRWGAIGSSSP